MPPKVKPMFFAYARKSPTGFDADKDSIPSLDRQIESLNDMAKRFPDLQYAGCFPEYESAIEIPWDERPVFKDLMYRMEPGDHLGVWRIDRIERKPFRLMTALGRLVEKNVTVHVEVGMAGLPLDLSVAHGRAYVMLMASMADMHREQMRDACTRGAIWRKKQGLHVHSSAGVGRRLEPIPGSKNGRGNLNYRVVWDEEQCAHIREVAARLMAGETLRSIAEDFFHRQIMRAPELRRPHDDPPGGTWIERPWVWREENGRLSLRYIAWSQYFHHQLLAQGKDLGDASLTPESSEALITHRSRGRSKRNSASVKKRWYANPVVLAERKRKDADTASCGKRVRSPKATARMLRLYPHLPFASSEGGDSSSASSSQVES